MLEAENRSQLSPLWPQTANHSPHPLQLLLQQGRYTWRHDSALSALVRGIQEHLDSDTTLYADLPGMRESDNPISTLPAIILVTSAHPDMVLVEEDEVIKLTIPQNSMESPSNARKYKSEKVSYRQALSDLYCLQPIYHHRDRITWTLASCIIEGSAESSATSN